LNEFLVRLAKGNNETVYINIPKTAYKEIEHKFRCDFSLLERISPNTPWIPLVSEDEKDVLERLPGARGTKIRISRFPTTLDQSVAYEKLWVRR